MQGRVERFFGCIPLPRSKRCLIDFLPVGYCLGLVTMWLDPRARRTLINLLRDLPITMLVSTHDMRLVEELFPRTIVMDEGLIVADGATKDIWVTKSF